MGKLALLFFSRIKVFDCKIAVLFFCFHLILNHYLLFTKETLAVHIKSY